MHFLVTGATGFIGRDVVPVLLSRGHQVTALVRSREKAAAVLPPESNSLTIITCFTLGDFQPAANRYDRLVHLAWQDTHKYTDPGILTENLAEQFSFLRRAIEAGINDITISGTCQEYGMKEGLLREDDAPEPGTYYALAKTTLWQMLKMFPAVAKGAARVKWLRYFYAYGPQQRAQSLYPQLIAALGRGDVSFKMSSGEQARDFLYISTLAHNTALVAEQEQVSGIVNIGTGRALKVIDFVNDILRQKKAGLDLDRGFYPLPSYEPFSFYADVAKLKSIAGAKFDQGVVLP